MASTLRGILGLSILLMANVACDDSGSEPSGPAAVAGSTGSGGSGSGAGGSGGGGNLPAGVPLIPMDGWVDMGSNTLGIQGALFSYADTFSIEGMTDDFTGSNACIKGVAAKVEMPCEVVPPAEDCYGTYWGAAIGLNLNQPIDENTGMGVDPPLPYDGSALTGFAFEITGSMVPTSLRFKVEGPNAVEYCTPSNTPVMVGANTFHFGDLRTECWTTGGVSGEMVKSEIVKIAWQVVTNDKATVPFDFCVSNIVALQ